MATPIQCNLEEGQESTETDGEEKAGEGESLVPGKELGRIRDQWLSGVDQRFERADKPEIPRHNVCQVGRCQPSFSGTSDVLHISICQESGSECPSGSLL
jgi:hypothetical protein